MTSITFCDTQTGAVFCEDFDKGAFTAGWMPDPNNNQPLPTIAALVALRIVWGFVGPRHARFRDFLRRPRVVMTFLMESLRLRAPRHLGHNPAGGAMIVALLATLAVIVGSGMAMTSDAFWGVGWVEELHEAAAYSALALVALHVAGVVLASFEHGENLVAAMVTGRKRAA